MKYIKTFESIEFNDPYDEYINNFKKFCEEYLAYIIDEGFSISIKDNKVHYKPIKINIEPLEGVFKWSEVKYDIIPFLELLSKKYELDGEYGPIELHEDTYRSTYTLYDVINGTGDFIRDGYNNDSDDISYISIYVKQPKPINY